MNASIRYLIGGGVVAVIVIGLVVGAIRPSKHAQAAPTIVPDIEVVQVQQQDVPIVHEWIGTFDGLVNADVRAQVTGYLLKQGYEEGVFVKKGQSESQFRFLLRQVLTSICRSIVTISSGL